MCSGSLPQEILWSSPLQVDLQGLLGKWGQLVFQGLRVLQEPAVQFQDPQAQQDHQGPLAALWEIQGLWVQLGLAEVQQVLKER